MKDSRALRKSLLGSFVPGRFRKPLRWRSGNHGLFATSYTTAAETIVRRPHGVRGPVVLRDPDILCDPHVPTCPQRRRC